MTRAPAPRARRKTNRTTASVRDFIATLEDASKRRDCRSIVKLMSSATGEKPVMWGSSIVGFGTRHYLYASGKPAELCKVGFAPRARSFAFYLPAYSGHASLLRKLGKFKYSGGCLHIGKLADVDADVLERMVRSAFRANAKRTA